jgi:NADP-dependent 3-hydroxy acid dehydrogenase YdfG
VQLDVTDDGSVAAFTAGLDRVDVLVNNAGGAFDAAPVAEADLDSWQRSFDVNVLGTVRMTKALLPALRASGAGDVVFVGSTAGLVSYEGGASYTAAKHGVHTLVETMRLELVYEPLRIMEIAPGMVKTDEFTLNRTGGDAERAAAVYRGVREPLVAEDIADCIAWAVTRPHHVNVDLLVVRPRAQAAQYKVARE